MDGVCEEISPLNPNIVARRIRSFNKVLQSDQLLDLWAQLNVRYFRAALPAIEIVWSRRLTASAGIFMSLVGPRARENSQAPTRTRRLIRLSLPLLCDQPAREIIGTLAHEMIHQWQYDILKRRPNHGPDFRRMMDAMNRDGLGLTVRHTLDEAVQSFSRYAWRCQQCGCDYQRQRRTIRPSRHRCGVCLGRLKEIQPRQYKSKKAHGKSVWSSAESPDTGHAMQLELQFSIH
ncbi:MAG: SprT-like domain-containing protein [Nitrospiraceae bacterium]